jgi:hypothetical protein
MLSLIPAILLLAFHGPTVVERYGDAGKLPEALRALERVWTPQDSGTSKDEDTPSLEKQRRAFASLAALTADPAFTKAVSQLFGLDGSDLDVSSPSDPSDRSDQKSAAEPVIETEATQSGFVSCRRSRDGPLA